MSEPDGTLHAALRRRFENVYVNPSGVSVIAHGYTSVFLHQSQVEGLAMMSIRAPALQNLDGSEALFVRVAMGATQFPLVSLYLFREGDGYDLDVECRVLRRWVTDEEVADLVGIVGATAEQQGHLLRPHVGGTLLNESGSTYRRLYAEEAMRANRVVADALVAELDTQRCSIMGAAEGAWTSPGDAVLGQVMFAMTATDLWLAGWPRHAERPAVWRVPCTDITEDTVRREHGATDYLARVAHDRWLGVRMIDPEAAVALATMRANPT